MKTNRISPVACITVLGCAVSSHAQEAVEPLITDRPDFTESTQTLAPGRTQVEGGATFTRSGSSRETSVGEFLVRVGAGKKTELRFGVNSYVWTRDAVNGDASGKDDTTFGVKLRLSEGSGGMGLKKPAMSLLLDTNLPTGSRAYRENGLQPAAKLLLGWTLNERLALASNLNYAYARQGGTRFNQFSGSVSLGLAVTDKTGAFFEVYGFEKDSPGGSSASFFNTGLTYLVSNDFQLDARVGTGIGGGPNPNYFFGVGAAQRF
ncbi:MAG TPA: transporter [Abditibacteriaceae bacterium]